MSKHQKPFDHTARLNQAVKRHLALRDSGELPDDEKVVTPLPRLEATSPDLSEWDNVIPIAAHSRWSWKGLVR